MTSSPIDKNELRQFLLGVLPQEAYERVEKLILTEDSCLDEVLATEDELIDAYISRDLSDEDRERFEIHFLSTSERHQKLKFAKALHRYISNTAEATETFTGRETTGRQSRTDARHSFWKFRLTPLRAGAAVAAVALLAFAFWFSFLRTGSPKTFATITLRLSASDRAEGAQSATVTLPPDADALRVSLVLPDKLQPEDNYRVDLFKQIGEPKTIEVTGRDARSISVVVPASELPRGQYAIALIAKNAEGRDEWIPGYYFFTVQ